MTSVFVGIIVVIGLFYLLVITYQHYILRNSSQIIKAFKKIQEIPIGEEINDIAQLKLSGASLKQFKEYQKNYDDIKKQNFEEIQAQINQIKKESRSLNFFKTQHSHNDLGKMVNDTGTQIRELQSDLVQIKELSQTHQQVQSDLKDKYKKMRKNLLAKNYTYGPASKNLNVLLTKDEKLFKQFSKTVKKGDQLSASRTLINLTTQTDQLERLIDQIPPLYNNFTTEFRHQVDEIKAGHLQMIKAGYNFPDDNFLDNLKYVDKQIEVSLASLAELDLDKARNGNHQINIMIEQLYDRMETELDAKRAVDKDRKIIRAFIKHAYQQNQVLSDELAQLNKNYDLNHHEIENTRQLREQIKTIGEINQKDEDSIKHLNAIYSMIQNHQEKAKHDLSQIEAQQRQINDSVTDLNSEEDHARETIQKYDLKLHGMNRRIENLNLPGIPDNYLDSYDVVDNEIGHLFKSMSQEKISMDNINQQLDAIRKDIDNLSEKTNSLIDSAVLAEDVIQYSNRYRHQNVEMAKASDKALQLFGEYYNYPKSLSVMSEALEKVEPGAFARIEKGYRSNNN